MANHPYISGAGNIAQIINYFRKSFPPVVNSDTIKKLGVASNNESYVINALQFLGIIDQEGNRTEKGQEVLIIHDDAQFRKAFAELTKEAYKDLFELRGDDAWKIDRNELIGYFRTTDKTSSVIGGRQAAVFQVFRGLSGYEEIPTHKEKNSNSAKPKGSKKSSAKTTKAAQAQAKASLTDVQTGGMTLESDRKNSHMALTVRVEINLPAEGSQETYDNIFKSIKENLLDA